LKTLFPILAVVTACLSPVSLFANLPGGGTNGPNVTLTDNGTTVTLANGIVSIVVTKSSASISTINYTFTNSASGPQTLNVLGNGYEGGKLYWEDSSDEGLTYTGYTVVADPATNGGNYAEVAMTTYSVTNIAMEVHFSLSRGNSGFYATPIWYHRSTDAGFSMGECRVNIYAGSMFNWLSVDTNRNKLMPFGGNAPASGVSVTVDSGPKETYLWTNGIYTGQYEDKYKFTADYGSLRAWGWSSVGTGAYNIGLFCVPATFEYMASGPMRRELTSHMGRTILNTPHGGHYGFCTDSTNAPGEVWAKVCGPYFFYLNCITNTVTATNTAAQTLWNDAVAQSSAEASAWPYSWFANTNYTPAPFRGTVTGKLVIADTYNPNASAANVWIGVEQQPNQPSVSNDFQSWYKTYQFWTKTDSNGNFTIPNVINGTGYTLFAFGPGAAGTFQSQSLTGGNAPIELDIPSSPFGVTVTAGATNNLGTVTWTPTRVGPTVFEIGYPDRTGAKFRHGDDYWVGDIGPSPTTPSPVWSKFLEYPFDFPNGPNYIVGQSRWTTDWNFIQPVTINSTGAYDPWGNNSPTASTITFNLPSAPASNGSLYVGLSSDYEAAIIITVNGHLITSGTGYTTVYGNFQSDASIREGIHGLFSDNRLSVPNTYLQAGQNTITITFRQVAANYLANHAMYDYLRLELPGYIPPAPTGVRAYAGNNCNLIAWPVQPGATAYKISRSTTIGSGYVTLTNGVTGPVSGSGWNNATFLDTTAANGTTYYYEVQSANTIGASTNSSPASATPNSGISSSAPATPSGLTVTGVAHQSVSLGWNAVANANFYTIYRSTLFNNGGGASNVLGTIVLANNVTNATYTDTSPTDGSIYSYAVAANSAGGISANSASAAAVPQPAPPATPPSSVFITDSFYQVYSTNGATITTNYQATDNFTWNPVGGAVGYAIYISTSAGGPFTFLQSVSTTSYSHSGLATNLNYYYRVVALNTAGYSANASDSINPYLAAPTSLNAVSGTNAQITLSWPAVSGATSYTVKRGTSVAGETFTVVSSYTGTTYTNSGLVNGTTYYYVVTANSGSGTSGNSPEASATPFANSSGIWISSPGGSWGAASNWIDGQIATGNSSTADFSTLALASNAVVTLDTNRTVSGLKFGDTSAAYNWSVVGTNTLTLGSGPNINVVNDSATISTPVAGTNGLGKSGAGTLILSASNSLTGGMTVNAGALVLDFTATNAPAANLIPTNALTFNAGTLQVLGNTNNASTQYFSGTTLNAGASTVSGTNGATINLATITPNAGGVIEFIGPGTIGAGGGNVASNAIITTPALGAGAFVGGSGTPFFDANFATVGLYDFAATVGNTSPYAIVGGSQISGFYTVANGTAPSSGNLDVTGNITGYSSQPFLTSMRFNTSIGGTVNVANSASFTTLTLSDILVTPNVGAYNVTFNSTTLRPAGGSTGSPGPFVFWQNNAAGELVINSTLSNSKVGAAAYAQAGPGTIYLANTGNSYTNQSYLNGGVTLINGNGSIGSSTYQMPVNLNGGTLMANATFALDNGGVSPRTINLLANGGGLAAVSGNSFTVDGVVGSASGAGPLTIGIAASGANNFTPGLLPGTGAGTANTTPVYATGTVILTNANYYTGGTILQSGTLNINGIFALGGANYGGLTFNGGTLQYAENFPGNNGSSDLTSIGSGGITVGTNGGTIDLNGNAVTYASSVGNNGSGSLLVNSSLAGGSLNLTGANSWLGNTTVTNATLLANNTAGSATGAGNVLIKNNAIIGGDGAMAGSVTVASGGALIPGGSFNSLSIGNNLTLSNGSATWMQVQHAPFSNSVVNIAGAFTEAGALIITNTGGALTNGDSFQLFNAANYAGAFSSLTLPVIATNLMWDTNAIASSGRLSVIAPPAPAFAAVQFDGVNLIMNGSGGADGWSFVLLSSTNLTAPVWTPVLTNQFDASGNFSLSNTINTVLPSTFYKLQLQ
jgi:autotransporter-associated beta strand protein